MAGRSGRAGRAGRPETSGEVGAAYRYVSLGLMFAGGILLFMGAGYALDRWIGTMPFGTVAGTLVGAVLSFLSVYRRVIGESTGDKSRVEGQGPRDPQ